MKLEKILLNQEFVNCIEPILKDPEFVRRKEFLHHKDSVYEHSIRVSYRAYKMARPLSRISHLSLKDVAIAGLLHDFYTTQWRDLPKAKFHQKHGFVHGRIARDNALKYYGEYMNDHILDSIEHHMFPLVMPPCHLEGWIITLADKFVSSSVLIDYHEWLHYLGMKKPKK